jgi:hypothetical protein
MKTTAVIISTTHGCSIIQSVILRVLWTTIYVSPCPPLLSSIARNADQRAHVHASDIRAYAAITAPDQCGLSHGGTVFMPGRPSRNIAPTGTRKFGLPARPETAIATHAPNHPVPHSV